MGTGLNRGIKFTGKAFERDLPPDGQPRLGGPPIKKAAAVFTSLGREA